MRIQPINFFILSIALLGKPAFAEDLSLMIYNQNFAVVKEKISLSLERGNNQYRYDKITSTLEPESLMLRPLKEGWKVQVLEQRYLANPLAENALLSLYEGQSINFLRENPAGDKLIQGKIIRSGWQDGTGGDPIIEVNGEFQFGLPGRPLFPAITAGQNLKPSLSWVLSSDKKGKTDLELSYLTNDIYWKADYNFLIDDSGKKADLVGWLSLTNRTGTSFKKANIQLLAGDVNRVQPQPMMQYAKHEAMAMMRQPVLASERSLDEYHVYAIPFASDLLNGETKQVQFLDADNIDVTKRLVFDGAKRQPGVQPGAEYIRQNRQYGVESHEDVWIMRGFKNDEKSHLGVPLPQGKLRFYKREQASGIQFVGENMIEHTPKGETVELYSGNAFDIVAKRSRTGALFIEDKRTISETFEIILRNHKKVAEKVFVVEHLDRTANWKIAEGKHTWKKLNSHTVETVVELPADAEVKVTYNVNYTW